MEADGLRWLKALWVRERSGWVEPSWFAMPMRPQVLALTETPAGPELLQRLLAFSDGPCPADHGDEGPPDQPPLGSPGFPCGCQVVLLTAWQAVAAWAAVRSAGALVSSVGHRQAIIPATGPCPRIWDPAREEVAMGLRVTNGSAASIISDARELMAHPEAAALASEGILPLRTVQKACESLIDLDPRDASDVVRQWAAMVRERLSSRKGPIRMKGARDELRRLVLAAPSYIAKRARARADRRVEVWEGEDGTATLAVKLQEETARHIHRRLTLMAKGLDDPEDDRPIDVQRADLAADLLLGRAETRSCGVEINVTVPIDVVLGLSSGTADLAGLGPIPGDVARELAADGRWRAWLTGIDGSVIATSLRTYRPTAALARLVRAREPECRMPGCIRPAAQCDLDHAVPWPQGATSAANLGPLCRRHHVMKTHLQHDLIPEEQMWRTPAGAQAPYAA